MVEEILKGLPPEINEFFLEDLAELIPLIVDNNDMALVEATKEVIHIYLRTDTSLDEYEKLFQGVQEGYSESKPKYNPEFLKKVEGIYLRAKDLKKIISEKSDAYIK